MKSKNNTKKTKPAKKTSNTKRKRELQGSKVKIKFRKHILPPLGGLFVAVAVFGFFNSGWLSARIEYYLETKHPHATAKPPVQNIDQHATPVLYIDSINVKAPVIFDIYTVNEALFLQALRSGVVHYPSTANPGQRGNIVIFGHSSGQWWAPGHYKFIFTLLDKVKVGDKIYIDYRGIRYIYRMYDSKVVAPNDLSVLNQGSDNSLTLITCTPVGTSSKRLIVRAKQIVPAVKKPTTVNQPAQLPAGAQGQLPGSSGSFWHNLTELF